VIIVNTSDKGKRTGLHCPNLVCRSFLLLLLALLLGTGMTTTSVSAKPKTLTVKKKGKKDRYDGSEIQKCLDRAKEDKKHTYNIKVPKGTYLLQSTLHIYSDTELNLRGVTLKHPDKFIGAMIQVGWPRKEKGKSTSKGGGYTIGGYKRGKNIKIVGGTFDAGSLAPDVVSTLFTFSHVKNLTIQDAVFIYQPKKTDDAHMIEFGGSKDIKILNCRFQGNHKMGEAVQIESTVKNIAGSDLMGKEDGTKTKNVQIRGCTFDRFEYGVGTNHGCSRDVYRGIVIKNNKFNKITKYAICAYNYTKAVIHGNVIKDGYKKKFKSYILNLGNKNTLKKTKNHVKARKLKKQQNTMIHKGVR